jgi:hypothetical protein
MPERAAGQIAAGQLAIAKVEPGLTTGATIGIATDPRDLFGGLTVFG